MYGDLTLSTIAELLNKQALDARNRLVEELDFLISHSDIPKKFQLLSVFGQGIGTLQHSTGLEIGTQEYVEFFGPLLPRVYQLLQRTRNVKRLSLQSLPLTEEISQAILSMDHVQTLTLKTCSLEDNVSHPLSASILNVVVHTDLPQLGGIWNLLRLLPKLRYLMISCFPQTISILPSVSTRTTYNPFLLLRRLFLSNVGVEDTLSLISWLRGTDGLKLALFKISAAKLGFSHPLTIQLIRALSRCPLIILVLDGIKYAEPYLLTLISDELPDLITLTLFYRDTRQKHTRPAHWPRPSWEYASYLRGFQKLEFFGWNLQITPPSITLDTMRLFEDGFPPDDIWSHDIGHLFPFPFDYNLRRKHIEDDEFLQEGASSIARAFAAYVPTLRIVAFFHSMYLNFRISRKEDGWVTVSREQYVSCGIMGLACPDDWQWEVSSPNRDGDIDED